MYKVILVDDEIWSLEGLAASFEWEENGFRVIGKYTESLEAIAHIKEECPDVVFTDIRMPDMTGLEMMKEIRETNQDTEFIVVSGYAQFEYAREAVRQGAFDYNLKPIDLEEADELLKRLKKRLNYKRFEQDSKLLGRILYEGKDDARLFPLSGGGKIQVTAIKTIDNEFLFSDLWKLFLNQGIIYVKLMINEKERIVVYSADDEEFNFKWIENLKDRIGKKGYGGVSSVGNYENLGIMFKEAILAASGQFIGKETGVTQYAEVVNPYYETYGRKLCSLILENRYEDACALLDEIVELVKLENLGIFYIVRLWNQIAIMLHENLRDGARVRIEYLDFLQITRKFENLDELCQYIKIEIAEILITQKNQMEARRSYNENFMKLLNYVDKNYSEKLNLNALSEQFFLNMSYCSELFKKVTGLNFSDYLTKVRMEKAASFLSSGNCMVKEVAELTGYSDAFYFSRVFKKYYGVTPAYFMEKDDSLKSHIKSSCPDR